MTLLHPCPRCKTPESTNRKDTYCTDCRGKSAALFMKESDDYPLERAMRFVERFTKQPRSTWEGVIGHPFVQAADILAKRLAGVKDKPQPPRRTPPNISVAFTGDYSL